MKLIYVAFLTIHMSPWNKGLVMHSLLNLVEKARINEVRLLGEVEYFDLRAKYRTTIINEIPEAIRKILAKYEMKYVGYTFYDGSFPW